MNIYTLHNIEFEYIKGVSALHKINLQISEGKIVSVIGSNGSGKSTLLHILCGLLCPTKGELYFKNELITEKKLSQPEFNRNFRASIGYIFQNTEVQLFCPTVRDELLFGPLQLGYSNKIAEERTSEIADLLCINHIMERPGYMLSGGEKKRVAIGAVLTSNPEILIFDEPMSGLDPRSRAFIIELILKLNQVGKTIIIATHHLELVNHLQSEIIVLSEKHTLEKTGNCDEILSDAELLMRNNLIGEYPHIHNGQIHRHIQPGYFFHNHPKQ